MLYSKFANIENDFGGYEEAKYLFCESPGHTKLFEFLHSPLASARSYAVKHLLRSSEKQKLVYLQQIIKIANPYTLYENYSRTTTEEDIWLLLYKIGISSSLCLSHLISQIKILLIYKKNVKTCISDKFVQVLCSNMKKNKIFWQDHIEHMNFVNNLWLLVEEKNCDFGVKKLFGDGTWVYKNLFLTIFPEFHVKKVAKFINFNTHPVFTLTDSFGRTKSLVFYYKKDFLYASFYYFIIKILLTHLQSKNLPFFVKVCKVECMNVRNQDEYGSMVEYSEIYPYDYKEILVSDAGLSLILFLLGLKMKSDKVFVSKNKKIVIDPSFLTKPERIHKYFEVKTKANIEIFRYWVISGYIACRDIFESILWIMNDNFWRNHDLHFYLSMPIQNAIHKINKRIDKDNKEF